MVDWKEGRLDIAEKSELKRLLLLLLLLLVRSRLVAGGVQLLIIVPLASCTGISSLQRRRVSMTRKRSRIKNAKRPKPRHRIHPSEHLSMKLPEMVKLIRDRSSPFPTTSCSSAGEQGVLNCDVGSRLPTRVPCREVWEKGKGKVS